MKKFRNLILLFLTFFIFTSCTNLKNDKVEEKKEVKIETKKEENKNAKYLIITDDGTKTLGESGGNGVKNRAIMVDENRNTIFEDEVTTYKTFYELVFNGDYAYLKSDAYVRLNLKTGKFEKISEKFYDKYIVDIAFIENNPYFLNLDGVNSKDEDGLSSILDSKENEKKLDFISEGIRSYKGNLYLYKQADSPKIYKVDKNLSTMEEVDKVYHSIITFTMNDDYYIMDFGIDNVRKIIRFSDGKEFEVVFEEKFIEEFSTKIGTNAFAFYETEGKGYFNIQKVNLDEGETSNQINGIFSINFDEKNSRAELKQIIQLDDGYVTFYNNCMSVTNDKDGVARLYDLETKKQIYSDNTKNIKAIIKLK